MRRRKNSLAGKQLALCAESNCVVMNINKASLTLLDNFPWAPSIVIWLIFMIQALNQCPSFSKSFFRASRNVIHIHESGRRHSRTCIVLSHDLSWLESADRTEEMAERRWTTSLLAVIGILAALTSCDTLLWQEEKVPTFTRLMLCFASFKALVF